MAKGDFYFPLYYKRLLTSTIGWSDAEFGAYVRLLIQQFDTGSIPDDINELALIAPSIKKNQVRVLKKFNTVGDGTLINDVMNEIYLSIQEKKKKNSDNGKLGGKAKHKISERLPNGNQTLTETLAIPTLNNKEQRENTGPPANLGNSNLFRKPVIPTKQKVMEVFTASVPDKSKAKEMAKAFWEKHEGTGWFINGSPIVNFAALAQKFITNWKEIDKKTGKDESGMINHGGPALKTL